MKQVLLFISVVLVINNSHAQWGQTQKITPIDRVIADEFGWNVVIQDNIAAVSAKSVDGSSSDSGAVYIYELDGSNNWVQTQKLFNSNARQFDRFGQSVDIDGDIMIIGARGQDYDENNANFENGAGAAYIFEKDGSGNWTEVQKIVASDRGETFQPLFGETVAISGDYAVVNAPREITGLAGQPNLTNSGACYIFEKDGNGIWQEVQKIVPSQRYAEDKFGDFALAIDGETIAVGTFRHDFDETEQNEVSSSGAIHIFKRDTNGIWNETQKVVASDREQGEWFGRSVVLEGNTLLVGASQEYLQGNSSASYGAVYAFEQDGNGFFNQVQKIRPNALHHESKFGHSLDIDGNRFVVGAHFMNVLSVSFGGTAFIFEKDSNGFWNQTAIMYDEQVNSGDDFGYNVSISGNYAFVGAFEEDEDLDGLNTLSSAGSAYVFNINEPNTLDTLENPLSIIDVESDNFKLFPNPTNEPINISLGKTYKNIQLSVYNVLGQTVFQNYYIQTDMIQFKLDSKPGIYLIILKTDQSKFESIKLIKH